MLMRKSHKVYNKIDLYLDLDRKLKKKWMRKGHKVYNKIDLCLDLARKLKEMWNMKVIVVWVLGTIPKNLENRVNG